MMISFSATLEKFGMQGEKTGWIYIPVSAETASEIKPNNKKSFKVKGKIDELTINAVELTAMVEGFFIIPVNTAMRKQMNKSHLDSVYVQLEEDDDLNKLSSELLIAIEAAPEAAAYFNALPPSHKIAYSTWVNAAKSEPVIAKRIAATLKACTLKMSYSDMMKANKEGKLTSP
jgi:Domain of unknown function (DUF1905)/Bacteriocin-protection, YdeI or OmpD-Associated